MATYLVVNVGSHSKRYALYREMQFARGWHFENTENHADEVLEDIERQNIRLDGVGFRFVHGGSFSEPTIIDRNVLTELESLIGLAPLHNEKTILEIRKLQQLRSTVPMVAVFDTSFHKTMPEVARLYALPSNISKDKHHLVRYGFHGISYKSIVRKTKKFYGFPPSRMIACHLGSGASVCAILHGKSIDTSMGFTPNEGLIMGTRSGDIDIGLVLHIQKEFGFSPEETDKLFNEQAGLKGLSGTSDVRLLIEREKAGDESAKLALAMFSYRIRKYIGSYIAALSGIDALIFSGAIGQDSPYMRKKICHGLEVFGIHLDLEKNREMIDEDGDIGDSTSLVKMTVIKTDELGEIALEMKKILS